MIKGYFEGHNKGEVFPLIVNDNISGIFVITNCGKATYTLENMDKTSNVKGIVVNRFKFDTKVKKKGITKIEIYDFDDMQSIEYRNENEQFLIR